MIANHNCPLIPAGAVAHLPDTTRRRLKLSVRCSCQKWCNNCNIQVKAHVRNLLILATSITD